jgi:hypothetical protein
MLFKKNVKVKLIHNSIFYDLCGGAHHGDANSTAPCAVFMVKQQRRLSARGAISAHRRRQTKG